MTSQNELLEAIKSLVFSPKTIVSCPAMPMGIPGITAGDALDAGDCIGTIMVIPVPKVGIIQSATYWDLDDESTQLDLEIFKESIAQIASDSAWSPTDVTMRNFVTELAFVVGDDHGNSYTFQLTNIGLAYTAPSGKFYIQAVDRSTKNIAAGSMPLIQLQIESFDPDFEGG